jgi:hypothetical protein
LIFGNAVWLAKVRWEGAGALKYPWIEKYPTKNHSDIEFRGGESNRTATALEWASLYGHGNVVSLSLEHGVNVEGLDCWS